MSWKDGYLYIVDRKTLTNIQILSMKKLWPSVREGWGITQDPSTNLLYVSDGTAKITVIDPDTLLEKEQFTVTSDGDDVPLVNELEWINGSIWANVLGSNLILVIEPGTGIVTKVYNCRFLMEAEENYMRAHHTINLDPLNNVFNGIAYDPVLDEVYVTGKRWNLLFKLKLI